jgi:hypothetical protein
MGLKRFLAGCGLVMLAFAGWTPPAGAIGGGACRITGHIAFSPRGDSAGDWRIDDGVIDCQGLLSGGKTRILGAGPFAGSGNYSALGGGGACLHQAGTGTFEYRVPTSGGVIYFSEPGTYTVAAVGALSSTTLRGAFELVPPFNGDCVTKPVTSAPFAAQVVLYRGVEPGV